MSESVWSAPSFAANFQPVQLQQGNDAQFAATVAGNPQPEVRSDSTKTSSLPANDIFSFFTFLPLLLKA
jgi:hypothetical protein